MADVLAVPLPLGCAGRHAPAAGRAGAAQHTSDLPDPERASSMMHKAILCGVLGQVCRLISNPKVTSDISKRIGPCFGDKRHKEVRFNLSTRLWLCLA